MPWKSTALMITLAASTLSASQLAAQTTKPNILVHHGRRHRHVEHRRLPPRHDGRADAEPRQDRQGRDAVHRLLRRGELHGGSRELHHRPAADPHRHDDGRPGGRQDRAARPRPCTIATALKAQGYATGQFGKNHLGDRNEFLPTVHGFDEFFGYLYHLDAMEDPAHPNYPQDLLNVVGPRNMVHSLGDRHGRPDRDAALGQGRQAEDRGRRHALSQADGDRGRRDPRPRA